MRSAQVKQVRWKRGIGDSGGFRAFRGFRGHSLRAPRWPGLPCDGNVPLRKRWMDLFPSPPRSPAHRPLPSTIFNYNPDYVRDQLVTVSFSHHPVSGGTAAVVRQQAQESAPLGKAKPPADFVPRMSFSPQVIKAITAIVGRSRVRLAASELDTYAQRWPAHTPLPPRGGGAPGES